MIYINSKVMAFMLVQYWRYISTTSKSVRGQGAGIKVWKTFGFRDHWLSGTLSSWRIDSCGPISIDVLLTELLVMQIIFSLFSWRQFTYKLSKTRLCDFLRKFPIIYKVCYLHSLFSSPYMVFNKLWCYMFYSKVCMMPF
jgi:hypothetical protein